MHNHLTAAVALTAIGLAAACGLDDPPRTFGTWANGDVVVVSTDSAFTLRFECLHVTLSSPLILTGNSFSVHGNFDNLNYKGTVTLVGTMDSQTMTFDLVPGTAPANSARREVVKRNGALPSWYPYGATCAD